MTNYHPGQLVRFEFPNGTAIEGYVRITDGEQWLDYMTGKDASWMGPWFNSPTSPLHGITPTILRNPPLISPPPPLTQPTITCPSCGHGIDPHGLGPCGVGDQDGAACQCMWSPNDIAAHR